MVAAQLPQKINRCCVLRIQCEWIRLQRNWSYVPEHLHTAYEWNFTIFPCLRPAKIFFMWFFRSVSGGPAHTISNSWIPGVCIQSRVSHFSDERVRTCNFNLLRKHLERATVQQFIWYSISAASINGHKSFFLESFINAPFSETSHFVYSSEFGTKAMHYSWLLQRASKSALKCLTVNGIWEWYKCINHFTKLITD